MTVRPHLTPTDLVGRRFPPDVFDGARVALMGFCPPPRALGDYRAERQRDQHFIHLAPESVRVIAHGSRRLLSLAHVYGGPVSSATVEELAYYGVEVILAYGLAGGLGTRGLGMSDAYLVRDAFVADGTTPHYTAQRLVDADAGLCALAGEAFGPGGPAPVRAATGDAIYREYDALIAEWRAAGCDVVNLDSAHLYAAARTNHSGRVLRAVQCGIVSDVIGGDGGSESRLADMLAGGAGDGTAPMARLDAIVRTYIERLAPVV
jgi:hypothetical protein